MTGPLTPFRRFVPVAASAAVALALAGCSPLGMGLMAATNLVTGLAGAGGGGAEGPAAAPAIGEQLASLDPRVSSRCTAKLAEDRPGPGDADGDPADARTDPAAQAATPASSAAVPHCVVEPVCLPGAPTPVLMRRCSAAPAAGGDTAAAQAPLPDADRTPAWDWGLAAAPPADGPQAN
jgi:hypothetical protein